MSTSTQWQLAREAAERYESILVPAILGPFARTLVEWSDLQPGEKVLDVGCGTGAATRFAAEKVGETGRIIGVDVNAAMLDVARSISAERSDTIEWQEGSATQLLFDDETFNVVFCAQTLQFIPERKKALSEMRRVARSDGRVAISLWSDINENPYFHTLIDSITKHLGADTAMTGLGAIFTLSDASEIRALLADTAFEKVSMEVRQMNLNLPNLHDFVPRHISATPMAQGFKAAPSERQQAVIQEIAEGLASFAPDSGTSIPFVSHLIMAEK